MRCQASRWRSTLILMLGLINEEQARARREAVAQEAEFCGAMDGAARFSQRDSVATILILAINIIAGFMIGVFQQGVPFVEALKTYTVLTVGDGLVSVLPSLLVSVAGGIVVTRAASKETLGIDMRRQLVSQSMLLWIAGGVLVALGLIPGLPKISFFLLGGGLMYGGYRIKTPTKEIASAQSKDAKSSAKGAASADPVEGVLKLDELTLEVGSGLIPLVDEKQGGQLMNRLKGVRKKIAQQMGFLVPPIHITDNLALRENEYVLLAARDRGCAMGASPWSPAGRQLGARDRGSSRRRNTGACIQRCGKVDLSRPPSPGNRPWLRCRRADVRAECSYC